MATLVVVGDGVDIWVALRFLCTPGGYLAVLGTDAAAAERGE